LDYQALKAIYDRTPGLVLDKLKGVLEFIWPKIEALEQKGIIFSYDEAQNLADHKAKEQYPLSLLLDLFQSLQRKGVRFMLALTGLPTLFPKLVEARTFPERHTHDYARHGTTTLFAALNVLSGEVVGDCMPRHRHQEFLRFLERIERTTPRRLAVHLILDNYGTHTHPAVEAWFATHPRYHRHFRPTGASWLNLVERFFAEITDKRIRRGTFRSVGELVRAIRDYIRRRNHSPQPFMWTASARSIARKVRHCNEALETGH